MTGRRAGEPSESPAVSGDRARSGPPGGRRRVFFYVHLPKCGGSTWNGIMRRNFGNGYLEEYRLLEPRELRYRREDLDRLIDLLPELRIFTGHCISADLPYDRADVEVIGISTVRDPLTRMVSMYFYNRNTHPYAHSDKRRSLEDHLEFALTEYDFSADLLRWRQLPDLADIGGDEGLARVSELTSSGKLHLFPLPRFDEVMCAFEQMWPEDFRDCAYAFPVNQSTYDQVMTASVRRKLELLAARPEIQEDLRLVELAEAEFRRLISKLPGGEVRLGETLALFRRRCARVRARETWIRGPLRRIKHLLHRAV